MDRICGQKPDKPIENEVKGAMYNHVRGAYNSETGDYMRWKKYMETVGANGNPDYGWATPGPWRTFSGVCFLGPWSTWTQHGPTSQGTREHNRGEWTAIQRSIITVQIPGFTAKTSMHSWYSRCQNGRLMADIFQRLPRIPLRVLSTWVSLQRWKARSRRRYAAVSVPSGFYGSAFTTTMLRIVHAKMVMKIEKWNECYDDGSCGSATGWLGMGGEWDYVYAPHAYVEGSGIVQQMPGNPIEMKRNPALLDELCLVTTPIVTAHRHRIYIGRLGRGHV